MKKIGKLMALALALSLLLCACGEKKNAFETAQQMIGEKSDGADGRNRQAE